MPKLKVSIIKKKPLEEDKEKSEDESDLRINLSREITRQEYECMICYDNIKSNAKIWSCKTCWAVFHLKCIFKWGKSSGSEAGWRCPGCQSMYSDIPTEYFCFCGKSTEPRNKLVPHSCQNACGRVRDCSHPCTDICHPGPCSPCAAMILTTCCCGKDSFMSKCSSKSFGKVSCSKVCEKLLSCSKHQCSQICHHGPCKPCPVTTVETCKCGKTNKVVECGKETKFQCDQECGFEFECKVHTCGLDCHDNQRHTMKCPFAPTVLKTCPCGKTMQTRLKCTDKVLTCSEKCLKPIPCGHLCTALCHEGECPKCSVAVKLLCRCEKEVIWNSCSEIQRDENGVPLCSIVCSKKNHCKRHRCGRKCCKMEVHICERICQKPLSCKLHTCLQQCGHPDRCHTCVEGVSFEERVCPCGRTKMLPPIQCNTPPIICHYPCITPQPCGHASLTQHNCHPETESCPPCMIFVPKLCHCGASHIPTSCSRRTPSCGAPCKGIFSECNHPCARPCHEGPCDVGKICRRACGRVRTFCDHICRFRCHGTLTCPQDKPCGALVTLVCPCGRIKVEKQCGACISAPQSISNTMEILCDDECLRSSRNAVLSEALGIDTRTQEDDSPYDPVLLTYAVNNLAWVKEIESKIKSFLLDTQQRHYYFPSRFSHSQNNVLLSLAEYYNLFAEIVDQNIGKGTVIYRKKKENVSEPRTLLSVASISFDPTMVDIDTKEPESTTTKKSGMNGLYFSDVQLGLDSETITTMISSVTSSEVTIEPLLFLKEEKDLAFKVNSSLGNMEKTLMKIIESLSSRLVHQNLVKSIQMINIADEKINFKTPAVSAKVDKKGISGENPFDLLREAN